MMILRDTDIRRALKSRQRGWVMNPFRFGGGSTVCTDGPVWTSRNIGVTATIGRVAMLGTTLVVSYNSAGNVVFRHSTDGGANWTASSTPGGMTESGASNIARSATGLVHVPNAIHVARSVDGQTWTLVTKPGMSPGGLTNNLVKCANNDLLLSGTSAWQRSTNNGATWTSPAAYSGVTVTNARALASNLSTGTLVLIHGTAVAYSTNYGVSWTAGTVDGTWASGPPDQVVAYSTGFVGYGSSSGTTTRTWWSSDGISWARNSDMPGSPQTYRGSTVFGGVVLISDNATNILQVSPDGTTFAAGPNLFDSASSVGCNNLWSEPEGTTVIGCIGGISGNTVQVGVC